MLLLVATAFATLMVKMYVTIASVMLGAMRVLIRSPVIVGTCGTYAPGGI